MSKSQIANYTLIILSAIAYWALAYITPRTDFTQLLLLYTLTFAAYVYLINSKLNIWHGIAAAVGFRLLFILAVPALSDDYYRFIWDGRLIYAGLNPYLYQPSYFFTDGLLHIQGITEELFKNLNSQNYFSLYPPVSQAVFWLSVKFSPESIAGSLIIMRSILLLAEIGSILLLLRLLQKMVLPEKYLLLYALNPLVILELTGNLHFEALMIFFLLLMLHQLFYQRVIISGIALGLAIGTKLIPLMFLPFLLRRLGPIKFLVLAVTTGITLTVIFYPLISMDVINNIFRSLELYFQNFEFNASIYYLIRWFGFKFAGYNLIAVLGPALSIITFFVIISLATARKLGSIRRLSGYMAAALTIYLLLATTVHPWYICTLIALTSLSVFRYAIVWSGVAILSYAAYRTSTYHEDLILVTVEYTLVFIWLLAELYLYRQKQNITNLNN